MTHDVQHAETRVHVAKQNLKKKAAETDLPTKHMVAESVNGLGWETRAKLNCQQDPSARWQDLPGKLLTAIPPTLEVLKTSFFLLTTSDPTLENLYSYTTLQPSSSHGPAILQRGGIMDSTVCCHALTLRYGSFWTA